MDSEMSLAYGCMVRLLSVSIHEQRALREQFADLLQGLSELHGTDFTQPFYVSIPDGGGTQTFLQGVTEIDFYEGRIIHPNGDITTIRMNLRTLNIPSMRSFIVITDSSEVKVSIDGGGWHTLEPYHVFGMTAYPYKSLFIDCTGDSQVKMLASTTNELIAFYNRFFESEMERYYGPIEEVRYDLDASEAQSILLDTGTQTRTLVEIHCDATDPLDFLIEASQDQEHWFSIAGYTAETVVNKGFYNTMRYIRLRTAAGVGTLNVSMTASR